MQSYADRKLALWEQEQIALWEGEPEQPYWLYFNLAFVWEGSDQLSAFFEPDPEGDLDELPEMEIVRSLASAPVRAFTHRIVKYVADPPDGPTLTLKKPDPCSIWKFYNEADELIFRVKLDTPCH